MGAALDALNDQDDDGYTRFAGWCGEGPTLDERLARCRPRWFDRAACAGMNPELWFPPQGVRGDEARAVCAGCEVRGPCGQLAADTGERHGIWAGLAPGERRRAGRVGA